MTKTFQGRVVTPGAAKAPARMSKKDPLTREQLQAIDAWWRAANYLTACQLYLLDNPLLRRPLTREDLKQKLHTWAVVHV